MNNELCIKILELKLSKWENIIMEIGSCNLKMVQNIFQKWL